MKSRIKYLFALSLVISAFSLFGCSLCNGANDDTEYQPVNAPITTESADTVVTEDETVPDVFPEEERLREEGFPVYESNRLTDPGGWRTVPFWNEVVVINTYDDAATVSVFFEEKGGSAKPIDEIPGYGYTVSDPIEVTGWKYPIYIYNEEPGGDYTSIMYLFAEPSSGLPDEAGY